MKRLGRFIEMDLRSLAAFRVAAALLVLVDLWRRSFELVAFHSDGGVLPRSLLLQEFRHSWRMSLWMMTGSTEGSAVLFVLAAACALLLLFGWRTRLMIFLTWLFVLSLHVRTPVLTYNGDNLLRLSLLAGCFLPLGARFSLDRWRATETPPTGSIASAGTLYFYLQISFVYWFTALAKWKGDLWQNAEAMNCALRLSDVTTPLGTWLLQFQGLLKAVTFVVPYYEIAIPFLLFVPYFGGAVRLLSVGLFCALQLSFLFVLGLDMFPYISMAVMLPFVPGSVWDRLGRSGRIAFVRAWLEGLKKMEFFRGEFFAPRPAPSGNSRPAAFVAMVFVAYAFVANLSTVDRRFSAGPFWPLGQAFMLHQNWAMFADLAHSEMWLTVEATLRDGSRVRLLEGPGEPKGEMSDRLSTARWRHYRITIWPWSEKAHYPRFLSFLKREWNGSHEDPKKIVKIRMERRYRRVYPQLGPPKLSSYYES